MLLSYDDLQQISPEALDTLIKEYILMQLEDSNLENLHHESLERAKKMTLQALKQGELIVEYSEHHESVMIRCASIV